MLSLFMIFEPSFALKLWNFCIVHFFECLTNMRVLANEIKSMCQLILRVRKFSIIMTVYHFYEAYSSTQWFPSVFVELIFSLSFTSRKFVTSNHEDSIFINLHKLLVKTFSNQSTFSFKEKFCNMQCVRLKCICRTELFTCNKLSLNLRVIC